MIASIAIRSPKDKRRYGFISRTMVFGAVAVLIRYNVFPRPLSEFFTQLFLGFHHVLLFDDFGAIAPAEISEAALSAFSLFCSKLGIVLKIEGPKSAGE